jgi:hypothetical protein
VPDSSSFDYAVVRVVPHVEREEFINAGVILFCRTLRFLDCRLYLARRRLEALAPGLDADAVQAQLDTFGSICQGGPDAGPIGELDQSARFHWLTAPRSTVLQVSPVHGGLCTDPQEALDDLFQKMVVS